MLTLNPADCSDNQSSCFTGYRPIVGRLLTICITTLLITSLFTTAIVSATPTIESKQPGSLSVVTTGITPENNSSYAYRTAAAENIDSLETVPDELKENVSMNITKSYSHYTGPDRISTATVFTNDAAVLSAHLTLVGHLNSTSTSSDNESTATTTTTATATTTPTATATATPSESDSESEPSEAVVEDLQVINQSAYQIAIADNRSTAIKLADAARAIAIAENRSLNEDAISEAKTELQAASTAFSDAQIDFSDAGRCCTTESSIENQSTDLNESLADRKQAVATMETAYEHAQQAIQILDQAGLSRLHINTRSDFTGGNTTRIINGSVFVTHPDEVDTVYVEVNNNRTETHRVFKPSKPLANATFFFTVNLTQQVNTIEVTANSSVNNTTAPVAFDKLQLDGDGLPDQYEISVTGTDPTDPDSSSNFTDADESDNGVFDSKEDYDSDGIRTLEEVDYGTNPIVADTDGDNLSDLDEIQITATDPTNPDSNQNGVLDGADDPDGDGLSNVKELEVGTDPNLADSDSDALNDPDELTRDTDPFNADTDDDFLEDGTEVSAPFNTDPKNPDTDGDGTVDGNETYTTSTANYTEGVEIDITGEGDVAAGVSIKNGSRAGFERSEAISNARAGGIVEISNKSVFEHAETTFTYNESAVGDESDLSVFRFNESLQTFVAVESSVDPVSDTVTANVSHFSRYTIFNKTKWLNNFNAGKADLDYMYTIVQNSGKEVNVTALSYQNQSVEEFYDLSYGGSDTSTDIERSDRSLLFLWNSSGNTSLVMIHDTPNDDGSGGAVTLAFQDLPTTAGEWVVQDDSTEFVSDSTTIDWSWKDHHNDGGAFRGGLNGEFYISLDPAFNDAATRDPQDPGNITRWEALSGDATSPNRTTLNMSKTTYIKSVPRNDEDRDGLPDGLEENGIPVSSGDRITTDPHIKDMDSDGLEDGEEILLSETYEHPSGGVFYRMRSDPRKANSDDDLLTDKDEVVGWNVSVYNKTDPILPNPYRYDHRDEQPHNITNYTSDPREADTDGDGVNDTVEKIYLKTNPRRAITYGVTYEHNLDVIRDAKDAWDEAGYPRSIMLSASYQNIRLIDEGESAKALEDTVLNDSNDDFEFLYTTSAIEGESDILDRFRYRTPDPKYHALDYFDQWVKRTDTWYPSSQEATMMVSNAESAWAPDTDSDGLTDGQEHRHITRVYDPGGFNPLSTEVVEVDRSVGTDATRADTDGDGYWDGWLGVYNASNSRHVAMYMELLNRYNMTASREVTSQAGIHQTDGDGITASIYGSTSTQHRSNLQIGELHWQTDPTDASTDETPHPSLTVELDYYEEAKTTNLKTDDWITGIEQNWALYGIDVDITRDETLSTNDFHTVFIYPEDGFSGVEVVNAHEYFRDGSVDEYWLVANRSERGRNITGLNVPHDPSGGIFSAAIERQTSDVSSTVLSNSPYDSRFSFVAASTLMHEFGHTYSIGRADDENQDLESFNPKTLSRRGEIYSGSENDPTLERLNNELPWPIMSFENNDKYETQPMEGRYFAFSVEEAGSVQ